MLSIVFMEFYSGEGHFLRHPWKLLGHGSGGREEER